MLLMLAQLMISHQYSHHRSEKVRAYCLHHQSQGIYLLSTLVQLRTSFPPPIERPDVQDDVGAEVVNLFSTLPEYQVVGSVFDSSFLFTAGASVVVRWFNQRINSVGVLDTS